MKNVTDGMAEADMVVRGWKLILVALVVGLLGTEFLCHNSQNGDPYQNGLTNKKTQQ
jgi:hypothetical protein